MKKNSFIFAVLIIAVSFFAFSWNKQADYTSLLYEVRKQEFVSTTTSTQLKANLAEVFAHDFEVVEQVDIHQSGSGNYYYVAYGQKQGQLQIKLLNASEEMVNNQSYPNRRELGIAPNALIIECYCQADDSCDHKKTEELVVCGVATDTMMECRVLEPCKDKKKPVDSKPEEGRNGN